MTKKRASKFFWAAKALLVGILFYVTVAVVVTPLYLGRALKPGSAVGGERLPDVPPGETRSRPPADLSSIVEKNLFAGGVPAPSAGAATGPLQTGAPVEQELGLRCIGAVAGGAATSRAVIQNTKTGEAMPYRIGDTVSSATIESIEPDRVILRHQGQRKALPLQSGAAAPQKAPAGAGQTQAVTPAQESAPGVQPVPQDPSSGGMGYVEKVLRSATIEPYVHKGRTTGLRITGLENTPLTGLLGLKNGDVVQTINGQTLTSKQKAFQVLQKAKTQPKLQIQLLRDGKSEQLSFDLQ
jgi:general secretion pathway protein C